MIDLNKKNTPFAESIMNCGATFLNPDTTPSLCYKAAKEFVDAYEHEQRHKKQTREMTSEDFECLLKLAEAVRRKLLPDHVIPDNVCDEEKHESPKPKRKWSPKKQRAYGKLLDCVIGRMSPETICNAAIELAQACKPEREEPKVGEVYRDIFGNRYIVFCVAEFLGDGTPIKEPFVVVSRENNKGLLSATYTTPLEDFMNPTFKKI